MSQPNGLAVGGPGNNLHSSPGGLAHPLIEYINFHKAIRMLQIYNQPTCHYRGAPPYNFHKMSQLSHDLHTLPLELGSIA